MTIPTTGSHEALWGTLAYLFQTEIASPLALAVNWPGSGFVATEVTVWGQVNLHVDRRGAPRRSHPGRPERFGTQVQAHLDVHLFARNEAAGPGLRDPRRVLALADSVRTPWPIGRALPFYDPRTSTVQTEAFGCIHVIDVRSEGLPALTSGVQRQLVRFDLQYLEESEV